MKRNRDTFNDSNENSENMNPCVIPMPQTDNVGDGRWMSIHNKYVSDAWVSESEILFIGDSIVRGLQLTTLWRDKISSLHCINFGIGGDRTQHILWRLMNGALDFNVKLKAVILFVGTNNTKDRPENVFEGILECVKAIRNRFEKCHIIIPTLLPRGQFPNGLRVKNNKVNKLLVDYFCDNKNDYEPVYIIPIHENIVQSDGTISHYIMYDYLHLTDTGYTKVWTPVYDVLRSIITDN